MPERPASELLRELEAWSEPMVEALIALVEQAERFGWDSHMRAALADLRRELAWGWGVNRARIYVHPLVCWCGKSYRTWIGYLRCIERHTRRELGLVPACPVHGWVVPLLDSPASPSPRATMSDHREIERLVEAVTAGLVVAERCAVTMSEGEDSIAAREALPHLATIAKTAEERVRELTDHYQRKLSDAEAALATEREARERAEADRDRLNEWVARIWDSAEQQAWDEQRGPAAWAREMRKAKIAAKARAERAEEALQDMRAKWEDDLREAHKLRERLDRAEEFIAGAHLLNAEERYEEWLAQDEEEGA